MLEPIKIYFRSDRTKILNVKYDFTRVSLTVGIDVIKKHLKNELALTIADEIADKIVSDFSIDFEPSRLWVEITDERKEKEE